MKKKFKTVYLLLTSMFLYIVQIPVSLARPFAGNMTPYRNTLPNSAPTSGSKDFMPLMRSVYDSLHLSMSGLSQQAFLYAKAGLDKLIEQGKVINDSIVSIIDFSQPSSEKRLYVLDLKNYTVLFNTFVAHGKNSGLAWARSFSNRPSSYKSSPGFYITGQPYIGKNGYSLRLDGIEKGINDNAACRAIVIHGAPYVSENFLAIRGYMGRSEGCPAIPTGQAIPVINAIKDKTCLFIYQPGESYAHMSSVLKGD